MQDIPDPDEQEGFDGPHRLGLLGQTIINSSSDEADPTVHEEPTGEDVDEVRFVWQIMFHSRHTIYFNSLKILWSSKKYSKFA